MSKMGRPAVDTAPVTVRLPSATLKQIDEARKLEDDLPTRPEMIRRMIDEWLQRHDSQ
jgi:Arc/MetJ-type ribon-helix-helix transcriptional regulator